MNPHRVDWKRYDYPTANERILQEPFFLGIFEDRFFKPMQYILRIGSAVYF